MIKSIKKAFLDTVEGQIFYRTIGTGTPLILLHGGLRSSDEFTEIMPILANKWQVIAPDLIGFGDSDQPSKIYTIGDYAQSIIGMLDSLEIKRFSILGSRIGGYIAGEIAAIYPERVDKLILCNLDYFTEKQKMLLLEYYQDFQISEEPLNLIQKWSDILESAEDINLGHRCFLDMLKSFNYAVNGAIGVIDYFHILEKRFGLIKCPTLILSGTEDVEQLEKLGLANSENRHFISQLIPDSFAMDIERGSAYMLNLQPEKIAQIVLAHLQERQDLENCSPQAA